MPLFKYIESAIIFLTRHLKSIFVTQLQYHVDECRASLSALSLSNYTLHKLNRCLVYEFRCRKKHKPVCLLNIINETEVLLLVWEIWKELTIILFTYSETIPIVMCLFRVETPRQDFCNHKKTSKLNKIKCKNMVIYIYSKFLWFGQVNSSHPN